jgi:hypothetical protein
MRVLSLPIALFLASCLSGGSLKQVHKIGVNPTTYIFQVSKSKMHETLMSIFAFGTQLNSQLYKSINIENADYPELSSQYVYFTISQLSKDEYLLSTTDFFKSYVFHDSGEPASLSANYKLVTLELENESTKISVTPDKLTAYYGYECCGHFGFRSKSTKVATETIVEYKILQYIGSSLDINNMPNILLPNP